MLLDIGCGDRPFEDGRGWIVQVNKPSNVNPGAMTVYVTCAAMAAAPAS